MVSMSPGLLEALLARNRVLAEKIGGYTIPEDFVINVRTLRTRLRQLHARPEAQPWLSRAIVLKQSQTMCGRIGFHSEPGPEELLKVAADGVELGYEIGESFRRRGIGKEAAIGLMKWAYEEHDQRCFVLSISPDNVPSLRMARSMGFRETGYHIDEEDGLELYFERRLDCWPAEWTTASGCRSAGSLNA
ncbi:MAG: GNAT family N-acetyltransferase [Gemmatimonadetes bacterium]|nr:GNAT family N-acetyltransferase [Gemmatimonadota bacterium]